MRIYRNVNLPIQIGCEVDDKIAEQLLKKTKDENFETRSRAVLELLSNDGYTFGRKRS